MRVVADNPGGNGTPMSTETKALLESNQSRIEVLGMELAEAKKTAESAKATFSKMADGPGRLESAEFKAAQNATTYVREIQDAIARTKDEQISLLTAGRSQAVTAALRGPDLKVGQDVSRAAAELASTPGAWLSTVLKHHGSQDGRVAEKVQRQILASAPGSITTGDYSTAAVTTALVGLLSPYAVALRSGIPVIPIDGTTVKLPVFTDLPIAGWIPEAGAFPVSAPGITMAPVEPGKVGLVSPISVEVFEDLSPEVLAYVQRVIIRAVALAFDAGILFGDGSDGTPVGIANTSGILTITQPMTGLRPFASSIAAIIGQNAFPGALVMNPLDLGLLFEMSEFEGDTTSNVPLWKSQIQQAADGTLALNLPYFGVPIWPTSAAPRGSALLYDPNEMAAVIRRDADIAIDPYYDFGHGMVGMRSYLRGDILVGHANAAIALTLGSDVTGAASTDVLSAAANNLGDGTPVMFTGLTGGAPLATNTVYYVIDTSGDTFKVSATPAGAAVNLTADLTAGVIIRA